MTELDVVEETMQLPNAQPSPQGWSQGIYNRALVSEVQKLFGADSQEHGLALAGWPRLGQLIRERHVRPFSHGDILAAGNKDDAAHDATVQKAAFMACAGELATSLVKAAEREKAPNWYESLDK